MTDLRRPWFLLRHYRRWANLDIQTAARRAGMSAASWDRYETGDRSPPKQASTLRALSAAVAVDDDDAAVKFEMLCRNVGYRHLFHRALAPVAGLVRHLAPEQTPGPGYLLTTSNKQYSYVRLLHEVADSVHGCQLSQTAAGDIEEAAESLGLAITEGCIDEAFSAFLYPLTSTIVVNPSLNPAERRDAIAHEMAHFLLARSRLTGLEYTMDALFGCDTFEDAEGERHVNWLASLLSIRDVDVSEISLSIVEDLARLHGAGAEMTLSRLCLEALRTGRVALEVSEAKKLVMKYPRIIYYW